MSVAAVACPAAAWAGPVRIGEPSGLGLLGPEVPDILKQARADPYAPPVEPSCAAAATELAALDEALGPDADEAAPKSNRVAKLATKAIRGLIPHRDVLRFVTGAGRKESALQQAAMAGWARRGFLKGMSLQMGCAQAPELAAAPAADVAPAAAPRPIDVAPPPLAIQAIDSPEPAAIAVNP